MMWSRISVAIGALSVLVEQCAGQDLDVVWLSNQINVTWCSWDSPRAAIIRDTLYIDGGNIRAIPGLADGSTGELVSDGNPFGLVYMLNFSTPFETSANFSKTFTNFTKAGMSAANNIAPNFRDGAMLANNYQWFTYGGLAASSDAYVSLDEDEVSKYQQYQYGPTRVFSPGWQRAKLPPNITRYVSNGAAVSVPSENLGFYFGGLRAYNWGAIDDLPGIANTSSTTLIEVNMATQNQEVWKNTTLPPNIAGRANAELVWIPVSEKGVLIAIGGVINPSFADAALRLSPAETLESQRVSPGFMSTVSVYDIDKQVWYQQKTTGNNPGQRTQGCTVVASAQDGTSHNIYWYGGYDGIALTSPDSFDDDVWVLSVPSFIWTKVKPGDPRHARAGHKCVKPYPDQMVVVGGYVAPTGTTPKCLDKGMVQIFNLSSAEWITSYDPVKWSNYTVPSAVYEKIGGSGIGGARMTSPAGGFDNSSLATVFAAKYDASRITNYFPYKPAEVKKNDTTPLIPGDVNKNNNNNNGTPSYLAPVLGVVLGLFFITLVILAILLFRRRKLLRSQTGTMSEAGTIENRRWIDNWLVGTPAIPDDKNAPTITTDDTPTSPYDEEQQIYVPPTVPEIGYGEVHEMPDTSAPVELHATETDHVPGLVPFKTGGGGLHPSASVASHTSHTSQTSTVSHISQNSTGRPTISPMHSDFSPTSQQQQDEQDEQRRIVSDMSGISEMERGHLRGISETSVSTINSPGSPASPFGPESYTQIRERERSVGRDPHEGGDGILRQDGGRPSLVSPLSPPGVGGGVVGEGEDYMLARGAGSASLGAGPGPGVSPTTGQRKSNFQESLD